MEGLARADGGAFMPPLIFFGSFLHQGKKEQDKKWRLFEKREGVQTCDAVTNEGYNRGFLQAQNIIEELITRPGH